MTSVPTNALHIPPSDAVSTVRLIDSTSTIHIPTKLFMEPAIKGHEDLNCPAFSFLVTNSTGDRHVLFDLGIRTDHKTNYPKHLSDRLSKICTIEVEKDVADILEESKDDSLPKPKDIESIIWSHHHFDHTGNPQKFPKHTSLVVGPGFKKGILPGYPADAESPIPSEMWEDRELIEIDMKDAKRGNIKIGDFDGFDYFGDQSFYLLYTPGHAPGHIAGLARVTPSTFVFMGGDAAHHGGEIRPNEFRSLPETVQVPSSKHFSQTSCPCSILENLQPEDKGKSKPFYDPTEGLCENKEDALSTLRGIGKLDSTEDVFIILAHDRTLRGHLPQFPNKINDWKELDLANKYRWTFIDDFSQAIDEHAK
ncbi:uncharacterized protein FA14DRAFT_162032 [Meira miltonrushii]|uniref:Metallo-beta-lactamase domain-containing protein n=1 Tax=Meira miltonrushii TaxID=1280837 RepID=A0A316V645_9BASI|nr:uncharacterized protein FA14DRAFT_162032 [Meira miltonrushii]PWN32724.1 hypothetical protein FA14DRAFT_162032 [Meira miltonrushii]